MEAFDLTFYHNDIRSWLLALVLAAVVAGGLALIKAVALRQVTRLAARSDTHVDDVAVATLAATRSWFQVVVALWAGSLLLVLPERASSIVGTLVVLTVVVQVGLWGATAIRRWIEGYSDTRIEEDPASVTTMRAVAFLGRLALWTVVFLMILQNLGIQITALIAGLGVGGIAVALAVQNILGDLFASLSIVLDKPFVVGDFIIVGDLLGTVERVGLKTTRVRSLSGEQLVFSNSDLLASRIRNFKRMFERRVVFSFGVVYQTPYEVLKAIPPMVREIVESQEDTRFDRAHFKEYGDSSLVFEVVYFVLVPDFNVYMDRQQEINLEIYRRFEERRISFAYPTRTLHVVPDHGFAPSGVARPSRRGE